MGEVVVFQHDPFEDLGFFAEVFEKQHVAYRVVRLFHGEMPEENLEQVKALIILGGPMNVDDETNFPILRWEKRIIRAAIDEAVLAKEEGKERTILFGLSGHGQLDMAAYDSYLSGNLEDYEYPDTMVKAALERLPKISL